MNQQQKQMQQEELTRERMAFLGQQSLAQLKVEESRQRLAVLHEVVDLLKAEGGDVTLEKVKEWHKEIYSIIDPPVVG
jgi:uncharacterized small protein (DUF1192 family)